MSEYVKDDLEEQKLDEDAKVTGACKRGAHMNCSGNYLEFHDDDTVDRSPCECQVEGCHTDKDWQYRHDQTMGRYGAVRTSRWIG